MDAEFLDRLDATFAQMKERTGKFDLPWVDGVLDLVATYRLLEAENTQLRTVLRDVLEEQANLDDRDHAGRCLVIHAHPAKLCAGCATTFVRLQAKRERARVALGDRDESAEPT